MMNESMNIVNSPLADEFINDKTNFTRTWQQNQYLIDSGINSALESHSHSVSSKHGYDDMDSEDQSKNLNEWKYPSNTNANDGLSNDICMLTPDTPGSTSCLRHGGEGMADVSLSACYDNKDENNRNPDFGIDIDKIEAESAIPDLIKLINDEDDAVVINEATMMVFQLSKTDAIDAIINSKEMISCMIEAMNKAEHAEAVRFLAGAIYNMSQKKNGLKIIFEANVIPCLVKLLGFSMESVLFYAITTLHNLLLYQDGGKEAVRSSGCIPKMVALLQKNNIKFLTICTDCLQILAFNHQPSKLEILKHGGPLHLIHIIKSYDYEKLLWTATRVLKVLSVCSANKPVIIREGGMDALTNILYHTIQKNTNVEPYPQVLPAENSESYPHFSQRLLHNCLWTLRNLSDAATRLNFDHLLKVLVQILMNAFNSFQRQSAHIDTNVITCAAGILSNLTCNNQYNKITFFKLGGVEAILRTIEWNLALTNPNAPNKTNQNNYFPDDIFEPCICTLRHISSRHEEAEAAQASILHFQGLQILIRIIEMQLGPDLFHMQSHQPIMPNLFLSYYKINWSLIKAIIGLIRNLAMSPCNFVPIRERGFGWPMIVLINRAQIDLLNKNSCANISPKDKLLEEIIEVSCGALHMLAKDPGIRSQIISMKIWQRLINYPQQIGIQSAVYVIASLRFNHLESIQRVTAGLLVEVSAERLGLELIISQIVITNKLNEMVHSNNEAISTYASAILIRATEEKNKRYVAPHNYNIIPQNPSNLRNNLSISLPANQANNSGYLNSILNSPIMHNQPPCVSHRHNSVTQCGDQNIATNETLCPINDVDVTDYHMPFSNTLQPQNRYPYNPNFVDPNYSLINQTGNSEIAMRHFKQMGSINISNECVNQDVQKAYSNSSFKSPSSHSLSVSGNLCSSNENSKKDMMDVCMLDADWIETCSDFSQGHSQKSWSPINK
uniref:Beta-catenin-like protein 1 n=1 Tax=Schmidtea mediterranea TaxID=79327 RepID=B1NTA7_SCHMD|nr:beta-catenin-like protein 1 [Schmidtea mediterranea]